MKKRILIIDDEPDLTWILKISLEREGYYTVRDENDPSRAVEAAREFAPDVVLLDMMMPQMAGSDVAARLRAVPGLRETPVVFLTGLADNVGLVPAAAAGQSDSTFLSKTAPLARLIECIENRLADRPIPAALAG